MGTGARYAQRRRLVVGGRGGRIRSAEVARLLVETARHLAETLDTERVYDRFHELLAETVPHDGVVVSSYDADEDLIRAEYVWTDGKKLDPAVLPPLEPNPSGEGMQTRVIRTGETLLENDVPARTAEGKGTFYNVDASGHVRKIPDAGPAATRAAIMVPVKHEGRVMGVVQLMSDRETYSAEQVELIEALVAQMSAAVRNAKLYEAAQAEIEARERAERELRESEARLRATFRNAAVGIAHVGLDGAWLRVNDRLCAIVGRPREQLLACTEAETTHPADRAENARLNARLVAGEIEHYSQEKRFLRGDGRPVWVSVTSSLLRDDDGRPLHLIAVVEDISARKRAEAERRRLAATTERTRAVAHERAQAARVLAAVGDGVVLVDDAGVVRLWNPAAERIVGLAAADAVGRRMDEVVPGWRVVAGRLGNGDIGSARESLPVVVGERELWVSAIAVRSEDGVVYAFRDETAERALERAKSDFVATVSHELRTPLAGIYGAALTLQRGDVLLPDGQRRHLLAIVAGEAERLARIVDEILTAAELDSGRIRLTTERVDLAAEAARAVAAARARSDAQPIDFTAPPGLPPVLADAAKVRQVLANLLDNALKYAPGAPVEVDLAAGEGQVVARVHDGGPGIPAEERVRIFEKFYRLDPDLTSGVSGTGLGLYICRELVERMGGRIWVENGNGGGATFAVALPRLAEPRA
ncbi:MAG: PAS domain S-box protein [Thermoleophilia bacterium]|nr:PAS domain S-box protein [Thermoleophilia bacterium]